MDYCKNQAGWRRSECRALGLPECPTKDLARRSIRIRLSEDRAATHLLLCDECARRARELPRPTATVYQEEPFEQTVIVAYFAHANRGSQFAVAFDYGEWPQGSLAARGWDEKRIIHRRTATPQEIESLKEFKRYVGFRVRSARELLNREQKALADHPEELEKLSAALERHQRQSNTKTNERQRKKRRDPIRRNSK